MIRVRYADHTYWSDVWGWVRDPSLATLITEPQFPSPPGTGYVLREDALITWDQS